MGDAINALLANDAERNALAGRAYARGRTMTWARVAEQAAVILGEMEKRSPQRLGKASAGATPLVPDLAAVLRMSDSTGMYQHGVYSVPDRHHGYCVDDNARALILLRRIERRRGEPRGDQWMTVYAAFVQHSWNPDRGRFRNFMRFDRSWCEDFGSEDSHGRALWSLGVTSRPCAVAEACRLGGQSFRSYRISRARAPKRRARRPLRCSAPPRCSKRVTAMAWRARSSSASATSCCRCSPIRRPDWPWFEAVLAYDNARLPEALMRAGLVLGARRLCRMRARDARMDRRAADRARGPFPPGRLRQLRTRIPAPHALRPAAARGAGDDRRRAKRPLPRLATMRWIDEAQRRLSLVPRRERPRRAARHAGRWRLLRRADPDGAQPQPGRRIDPRPSTCSCAISRLSKAAQPCQSDWMPSLEFSGAQRGSAGGAGEVDAQRLQSPAAGSTPIPRASWCGRSTSPGRRRTRPAAGRERLVEEVLALDDAGRAPSSSACCATSRRGTGRPSVF